MDRPALDSPRCPRCGGSGFVEVVRGPDEEGVETCPACGGRPHPLYEVFRILDRMQGQLSGLREDVDTLMRQSAKQASDVADLKSRVDRINRGLSRGA
jgi:hypothetical protein